MLIVDDDARLTESLRDVLSDEFDVDSTTDPGEALARLTSGRWYDVILCDVMMPALNGIELRNAVSAVDPELATRIVFVTGGILMPRVQDMLDGVANTVLAKPFDFPALRELIRRRRRSVPPPAQASTP